jgi:hypothetical protein
MLAAIKSADLQWESEVELSVMITGSQTESLVMTVLPLDITLNGIVYIYRPTDVLLYIRANFI